ncbi:hypothetical protein BLNAU_17677 [Blattamonas nauphoetae]|uniref:RING-type domain-containing protein n=1 Tax=Blattamonas nauphoetae TaxID=2049346 RepID=A0ABQ9X6N0_9EUKA|nr:hypothetical protein BLNAU_17677 [Blattamonas nauphoetae]
MRCQNHLTIVIAVLSAMIISGPLFNSVHNGDLLLLLEEKTKSRFGAVTSIFCLLVLGIFCALFLHPLNSPDDTVEALKAFGKSILSVINVNPPATHVFFMTISIEKILELITFLFCLYVNSGLDALILSVRYSSTIHIPGLIRFILSAIITSSIGLFYLNPLNLPVFIEFPRTDGYSEYMGATMETQFALNIMYTCLAKVSELLAAFLTRLSQKNYENVAFVHFSRYFAREHRFFTKLPLWKKILAAIPTAIVHCAADLLVGLLIGFFSILRLFSHKLSPLFLSSIVLIIFLLRFIDTFIPLYYDPQFEWKNLIHPLLPIFASFFNDDINDAVVSEAVDQLSLAWSSLFIIVSAVGWGVSRQTSVWEGFEDERDEWPKEEAGDEDIAGENSTDPTNLAEHAEAEQEQDNSDDVHLRQQFEDGREEPGTQQQNETGTRIENDPNELAQRLQMSNFHVWDEQLDQPANEIPPHLLSAPSSFLGLFPSVHRRFVRSLLVPTFTLPSQTPCGHTFHKECLDDWLLTARLVPAFTPSRSTPLELTVITHLSSFRNAISHWMLAITV